VAARWNFANVPNGAPLVVQWYRDSVLMKTTSLTWNTGTMGSTGATSDTTNSGLSAGNWSVRAELTGFPGATVTGNFTYAAPAPTLANLSVSAVAGGPASTTFPYDVGAVYAAFDFANVPAQTELRAQLVSTDGGALNLQLVGKWTYVSAGRVTDLWIGDPSMALPSGAYRLTVRLTAFGVEVSTDFTITAPPDPAVDLSALDYYIPPQLDPAVVQPAAPVGPWERLGP
jgi:hypothetical protein